MPATLRATRFQGKQKKKHQNLQVFTSTVRGERVKGINMQRASIKAYNHNRIKAYNHNRIKAYNHNQMKSWLSWVPRLWGVMIRHLHIIKKKLLYLKFTSNLQPAVALTNTQRDKLDIQGCYTAMPLLCTACRARSTPAR